MSQDLLSRRVTGVRVPAEPPAATRVETGQLIPAVTGLAATTARIGMGASLGALAMLHAHCRSPGTFGGLVLQSGSFFVPLLDPQERRFRYYRRITGFTAALAADGVPGGPVPVSLTCGSIEENIANNRLMTTAAGVRKKNGGGR